MGCDALANGFHHFQVDAQQVITAHAGFARHTCGDDADVGARNCRIIAGASHGRIDFLNRAGLGDVERFALGKAVSDVKQNDVAEFFDCCEMGERAADVACANKRDLGSGHGDFSPVRLKLGRCLRPHARPRKGSALRHVMQCGPIAAAIGREKACK